MYFATENRKLFLERHCDTIEGSLELMQHKIFRLYSPLTPVAHVVHGIVLSFDR